MVGPVGRPLGRPVGGGRRPRRRLWHISPDGFRELRHACLLSRKACAEYLGVSLRTVRYWDAGRSRVPWSAVRLLRLLRTGDLGALCDEWAGWTINRLGLHAPAGRTYRECDMRRWWLTIEQAHLFLKNYEATTRPAAGRTVPAAAKVAAGDPLQPGAGMGAKQAEAAPSHPIEAVPTSTALARSRRDARDRCASNGRAGRAGVGMAGDRCTVAERFGRAAAARSGAGLVSSSKQVERHFVSSRFQRRLAGVWHAG